ncbi:MAG: glutamate synthase subunit alpha, partial [Candidatus Omnitrophica bacterium]|nr:glutamate synthase subunit alpha [Candidatus Omnitrophota bacterium]
MEDLRVRYRHIPEKQGLYDPRFEHDSCGVGFVCNIQGKSSHAIVRQGIEVLNRLSHRGAVGADPDTGDGAGILIQIPHKFFKLECSKLGIALGEKGSYGTGFIFFPKESKQADSFREIVEQAVKKHKQVILGWRDVPLDNSSLGKIARETQPRISQIFIGKGQEVFDDELGFERRLYVIRKEIENALQADYPKDTFFYITNLSSRTISYKGLLKPEQLDRFFLDLNSQDLESAIALVHSRYSTNTFPTWDLAQPFRFLAHNGEINTLRGNINWMRARERLLSSKYFGTDIELLKPVIVEGGSDSAIMDNVFELLVLSGRTLEHSMMMLIPEAWEHNASMDEELKAFYQYHSCFMEPWDGPAAVTFTDGKNVGAVLDRNGLRTARYIITKDDLVVMASEVGVLDIDEKKIKFSGRLEPGKLFFIDTKRGLIVDDSRIKKEISSRSPYCQWNKENLVELDDIPGLPLRNDDSSDTIALLKVFGYSREDLKFIIKPMCEEGKEPLGSMGND